MRYQAVSFLKWVVTSCTMWGSILFLSMHSSAATLPRVDLPGAVVRLVRPVRLEARARVAPRAHRVLRVRSHRGAGRDRAVPVERQDPDRSPAAIRERKEAQEAADPRATVDHPARADRQAQAGLRVRAARQAPVDRPAPADRREQVGPRVRVVHLARVEPLDPVVLPGAAAVPARVDHRVLGLLDPVAPVEATDRVRVVRAVRVQVPARVPQAHPVHQVLPVPRVHRMVRVAARGAQVPGVLARQVSVQSCGSRCTSKASGADFAPNRAARFWSGS